MTDKEIIKALECCMRVRSLRDCLQSGCPARTREGCSYYLRAYEEFEGVIFVELIKDALDLITRKKAEYNNLLEQFRILDCECGRLEKADENQEAEIERLKIENQAFRSAANSYKLHYNEARTEAVKEFADELCKGRVSNDPVVIAVQAELNMTKGEAKPEKCDCFCKEQRIKGWINSATPITEPITVCNGTRERDECTCGGDKSKCDFYPKDYSYGY